MEKIHYITIPEIVSMFGKNLTKKEIELLTIGDTITINSDQITIIKDSKHSKTNISYE